MQLNVRELTIIKNELTLGALSDIELAELREKISKEIEKLDKDNKDKACGYCQGSW